jgi:hypothetical protein
MNALKSMTQNKKSNTGPLLALTLAFCALIATNTLKAQQNVRDHFLVDKIYDYNHSLLAEYTYDEHNNLSKRVITDTLVESKRTIETRYEDTFVYENGRVSKIKKYSLYVDHHSDRTVTQESNGETTFEYDAQGRPIRKGGGFLYENGFLVSTYGYTFGPCFYRDTLKYDQSMNVIEYVFVGPESNMIEEFIKGTYRIRRTYYEYDDHPKPNFSLDYLFTYEALPQMGTVGNWQRGISKNNMLSDDTQTWIYTYNEHGLPATIETKWNGIETLEPMLMRLTYKPIGKTSLPEVTQETAKINIYPNPARDKFFIECKTPGTLTLYDILGKKVLSQNINGRSEINIAHLPKGVYTVSISSENKIIQNGKMVKQ